MESVNGLFPIFLKPQKLKILIVGGGNVAEEKVHFLLKSSANAQVHIVSRHISKNLLLYRLNYPSQISFTKRPFQPDDVQYHDLVLAATDIRAVNKSVYRAAKKYGKLINVADTPLLCDFYMGSIVTKGDLKIAISTNGKSPTFAKRFRQVLEESLPEDINILLRNLHKFRNQLKGDFSNKVKTLNNLTENLVKN